MKISNSAAIIVTFNPTATLKINVHSLLQQVEYVIVIDNSNNQTTAPVLETICSCDGVILIKNGANLGLAQALNQGLVWARLLNCIWVYTFDQDSFAFGQFCQLLLETFLTKRKELGNIIIASPTYINLDSGLTYNLEKDVNGLMETTMTSGNLIDLNLAINLGGFREDFFIDYIDVEFNLRARHYGYKIIEVKEAVLEHNLGNSKRVRFLYKNSVLVTNHSASRRYYNARNRVRTYIEYFPKFPNWVYKDLVNFIREVVKLCIYEDEVKSKLSALIKGIYDGLTAKMGQNTRIKL